MEKALKLKAEVREQTGSKYAKRVRKKERVPAIVYGHKEEPVAISLDRHDFIEGLHHGHRLLDVEINGKGQKVLVKDLQYGHLGRDIIHADLMRVDITETVRVNVPIELKGTARGSHEGGIINEHTDSLEVECRVTDIPEKIVISVKEIGIGDSIHAENVGLPAGVKLVSEPSMLIATCSVVAAAKTTEELEAEAPVAPEVITEVKAEGEEEGQEESSKEES